MLSLRHILDRQVYSTTSCDTWFMTAQELECATSSWAKVLLPAQSRVKGG